MERFKKYVIGGAIIIIFVAAIITALRMSSGSRQTIESMNMMNLDVAPISSKSFSSASRENGVTDGYMGMMDESAPVSAGMVSDTVQVNESEKKEIKNGSLTVRVNDADHALEDITSIAKNNHGEIFSSNFYQTDQNIKNGTIEIRVPVDRFGETFDAVKKVATLVMNEATYGEDVTMAFHDLQVQIKNKQAEEQSFLKILDQAGKVSDVLEVTREVSRVRGEIERLQGQVVFMESQTDFARISISVTEDTTVTFSDQWRPMQIARETINSLLKDMQGFVNFVIVLIVRVIPIVILYGIIVFIVYKIAKKVFVVIRGPKDDIT